MVHTRSKDGGIDDYVSFTIRDEYSGMGAACPSSTKSADQNYKDLKKFVGNYGETAPNILVKAMR